MTYPVARRYQEWAHFINTRIELKRRDGTIEALYGHWILGKQAAKRQPRWSIMRYCIRSIYRTTVYSRSKPTLPVRRLILISIDPRSATIR